MRLEHLISGINEEMLAKIQENQKTKENLGISTQGSGGNTAKMVALAAIKYGDLSNQASKDYIFDIDRFTSFEGNTGPYNPVYDRPYQIDLKQISRSWKR